MSKIWIYVFASLISFTFGCATKEEKAGNGLKQAVEYFEPLNDFRAVTCDVQVHLPESFKARKKAETKKPKELKAWNDVFEAIENRNFTWSTSMGRCWVRGMSTVKKELKEYTGGKKKSVYTEFMDSLDAQMRLGNCVLLQALYYNSPLKDLRYDEFKLGTTPEESGFVLLADNGKSEINWSPESKTLTSKSQGDEIYIATYEGAGKNLRMKRAALMSSTHQATLEEIKYKMMNNRRLVVDEYILSLEENGGEVVPQARVNFSSCVARAKTSVRPLEEDIEKGAEKENDSIFYRD